LDKQRIRSLLYKSAYFLSLLCFSFFSISFQDAPVYEHRILPGPLSVHILEVDPSLFDIQLEKAQGYFLSLEKTSSIAKRHHAVAAVNGGFFRGPPFEGCPSGALKIKDNWLSTTQHTRGAIGWSESGKTVFIDRILTVPSLLLNDTCYSVDCINQPRKADQAVIYTWGFYDSTLTSEEGLEMRVDSFGKVRNCSNTFNSPIPIQGWVYSRGVESTYPYPSSFGMASYSVSVTSLLNPYMAAVWNQCENILGGTPVLIYKNQIAQDHSQEKVRDSFLKNRHPRTAIGIKPNGCWVFVVVDGRQETFSIGMTIEELSIFMQSLGCEYALNLDGGGSSTMVFMDEVKNAPSGHEDSIFSEVKEEPVSDAIVILKKEKKERE
jgi:hypothetical protein